MKGYYYVGLDVHKNNIAYCVKRDNGEIVDEGTIPAHRPDLIVWACSLPGPWSGLLEATLFTEWIYDCLEPLAAELKVAQSFMLKAICASKKKNDQLDARKLADALRCDLVPYCYMPPREIRELRRVLRYRGMLVREAIRFHNKTAGLLMESGVKYSKQRLSGRIYFEDLMRDLEEVPDSVIELLYLSRSSWETFCAAERRLVSKLVEHPLLSSRVELLQSIPGVGEIMALTWALEIDDPHRFGSIKEAVSFCGLCSAQDSSAGKTRRGPLSKQRNRHLQTVLVEVAKLAPRWNEELAAVREKALAKGSNKNEATLAVARKLVAYLLAVDKRGSVFVEKAAAA